MDKEFHILFNEQIRNDALQEIKARKPGHTDVYYNMLLNKAQNIARHSNWKRSTMDVVLGNKFWKDMI